MHPSLLTHSMVNDLLAQARQKRENSKWLMPTMYLLNGTKELKVLTQRVFEDERFGRLYPFYVLGKRFPDTTEAVLICDSWFSPDDATITPYQQNAITVTGRNRSDTKRVFAKQEYSIEHNLITWQKPDITIKSGFAPGVINLVFAP